MARAGAVMACALPACGGTSMKWRTRLAGPVRAVSRWWVPGHPVRSKETLPGDLAAAVTGDYWDNPMSG